MQQAQCNTFIKTSLYIIQNTVSYTILKMAPCIMLEVSTLYHIKHYLISQNTSKWYFCNKYQLIMTLEKILVDIDFAKGIGKYQPCKKITR